MTPAESQKQSNAQNVKAAAERIASEVMEMLKTCDFFTSTLTITAQGGIVRTAKVASEECINFHAPTR